MTSLEPFEKFFIIKGIEFNKKKELDKKLATFFCEIIIPFNIAPHDLAFIEVVKATLES
jgi:hypothetical protein